MPVKFTAEQLARAVNLRRRGWTYERIASELDVSPSTVFRAFKRRETAALAKLADRAAAEKMDQLEQLAWIASEAIEGWERSTRDAVTLKTVEGGDEGDGRKELTRKSQAGNPAFLAEARAALADIRKLLGIETGANSDVGDQDDPAKVLLRVYARALEGDVQAAQLYLAYALGRPAQSFEISGPDGEALGPDWGQLITIVLAALAQHPAARIEVAAALRSIRGPGPDAPGS